MHQDASFEPLAASVSPTGWSVAMHKEKKEKKNRRLMANFAHAQARPLWTDCYQILRLGSGGWCDHWCQVLWKSVEGFWSYRTPQMPFPIPVL